METVEQILSIPVKEENGIDTVQACVADETIEDLVYGIEALRVQMKVLTDQDKALKDELKELVGNAESIVDHTGYEIATWKTSYTNRFDTDSFKKDFSTLYERYVKSSEQRRFMTKPRKIT